MEENKKLNHNHHAPKNENFHLVTQVMKWELRVVKLKTLSAFREWLSSRRTTALMITQDDKLKWKTNKARHDIQI